MRWPLVLPLLVAEAQAVVFLGSLSELSHGVRGRVAALSQSTLLINRFNYDGLGPEAFFLVGTTGSPGIQGTILSHPWDGRAYGYFDEDAPIIGNAFMEEDVMLQLPDSIRADEVAWVSVWSRDLSEDFGSLLVPQVLDFSNLENRQQRLPGISASTGNAVSFGRLSNLAHNVQGRVSATGPSTILFSDFTYDGLGPAAFFIVGTSGTPQDAKEGTILSFPYDGQSYTYFDQNAPILRRSFNNEEVKLTLPASITVDQVVWVSVWCRRFEVAFGSVQVPRGLDFSSLGDTSFVGTNFVEPSFVEPRRPVTSRPTRRPVTTRPTRRSTRRPTTAPLATIMEPSFVEPSFVEPSFVEPSFVEPMRPVTSRPDTFTSRPDKSTSRADTFISRPVTARPTRRSTRRPRQRTTTTSPATIIINPDAGSQFELVPPDCFSFSAGRTKTIIPGTLDISAGTLLLPRFGRTLAITLPRPALMVEAYANNWDNLSKLMSADGLTWRLDLGERQELEVILVSSTMEGGASSALARVVLEGGELANCQGQIPVKTASEVSQRQAGQSQQAACVELGMAVYGNNIAVQDDVDSPAECWEICRRMPACRFWNHNMYSDATAKRTGKLGRCHVKNKRGRRKGTLGGYTFGSSTCRPL